MVNTKFLNGRKVLVAGGTGLVGTNLTQRLADAGACIKASYFSAQPLVSLEPCYQFFDFTRYQDCLAATRDQEYVFVCAAQSTGVAGMARSPTASILPNLEIHAGLLEACRQNKVKKVVLISSSTVYQAADYPVKEQELDLNQPTFPLYQGIGWVYRYLEQLALCYGIKTGLEIGIIRTSSIYGPHDHFDDLRSHVIPALIKRALAKEDPFVVWGDSKTVRDFVYVDDVVEAMLTVLADSNDSVPVNFSHGVSTKIAELVDTILHNCGHSPAVEFDAEKPTAVPYRVLDNSQFQQQFGTQPRTSLQAGIEKTIDWYQSALSGENLHE